MHDILRDMDFEGFCCFEATSYLTCTVYFFSLLKAFEVNFMDDVGQTLLNWASAFGTQEMVGFIYL